MNIEKLNDVLTYKDFAFCQAFHEFICAANDDCEYKLFYNYIFRTDVLYDSILKHEYVFYDEDEKYLLKSGKINYRNATIKKYVNEHSYTYVGRVYTNNRGFRPIFITSTVTEDKYGIPYSCVSGFSIKPSDDDFYFDERTTRMIDKLPDDIMHLRVGFSSDELKDDILKMIKKTADKLGI